MISRHRVATLASAAALICASELDAQRLEPVAARGIQVSASEVAAPESNHFSHGVGRTFIGGFGGVLGGFVGIGIGIAAYEMTGPHNCLCEDPGWEAAIGGMVIGMAAVTTLFASLPTLEHKCGFMLRWKSSAIATILPTLFGVTMTMEGLALSIISTPIAAALGAESCK